MLGTAALGRHLLACYRHLQAPEQCDIAVRSRGRAEPAALLAAALIALGVLQAHAQSREPDRVTFASADGRTTLVGYLFRPRAAEARSSGVVMMHGRAGAYGERAAGIYDASTLSLRHRTWGHLWADAGYIALLVDGFGPRGYPAGFPPFSYATRPDELNEVTVRPLDAYGALAYLRAQPGVRADRIGLQGWSNGASATLSAMSADAAGWGDRTPTTGFRAALAFYPGCGLRGAFDSRPFHPYAPVLVLQGTADEEVSYQRCAQLVAASRSAGGDVAMAAYPGATHSFDVPSAKRQSLEANAEARRDALTRARDFFGRHLAATAD